MKKTLVLLNFLIIASCSSVSNYVQNYIHDNEVECPKISSPKGSEELIVQSENNIKTYVGLRGIQTICKSKESTKIMNVEINVRAIRNKFDLDDNLPLTISLVSLNKNKMEYDRDEFAHNFFLKKDSKIVERISNLIIEIPEGGEALIGLFQK